MVDKEKLQNEGERHQCTFAIFCDDTGRIVYEDKNAWLVIFPGQSIERVAKKYAFMNQNYLFTQHRKRCTGVNSRKHSVTIRFEVDNFLKILFVPLGVDK